MQSRNRLALGEASPDALVEDRRRVDDGPGLTESLPDVRRIDDAGRPAAGPSAVSMTRGRCRCPPYRRRRPTPGRPVRSIDDAGPVRCPPYRRRRPTPRPVPIRRIDGAGLADVRRFNCAGLADVRRIDGAGLADARRFNCAGLADVRRFNCASLADVRRFDRAGHNPACSGLNWRTSQPGRPSRGASPELIVAMAGPS
jgi:hypothetical protein